MKLCFVSREFPPDIGGVGRATYLLADALGEAGHDVTVVTGDGSVERAKGAFRLRTWDTGHRRAVDYWGRRARGWRWETAHRWASSRSAIEAALEESRETGPFDVTEFWLWGGECVALRRRDRERLGAIAVRLSTPDVQVRAHHGTHPRADLDRLELSALDLADLICAISPQVGLEVRALHEFDQSKLEVSALGLPAQSESGERLREPPLVAFVGRLERRKGIDDLIAAIPAIRSAVPDCRFVLAGSDGMNSEQGGSYATLVEALEYGDRAAVTLAGRVSDAERDALLRTCTLAVFPSRYESFGLAILEALSSGAPVVATDVGGIPFVTGEYGAVLVPPHAPSALAQAVVGLLQDPEERRALSVRARDRAGVHSVDAMCEQALEAYSTVLGRR